MKNILFIFLFIPFLAEAQKIISFAGNGVTGSGGDGGPATAANLRFPYQVASDKKGNIYIADGANCKIRKVDISSGIITTVAGNGIYAEAGDGGPATAASLDAPFGVAVDKYGNIYTADNFG